MSAMMGGDAGGMGQETQELDVYPSHEEESAQKHNLYK